MFFKLLLVILIIKYIVRHLKGQLIKTSTNSREFYPRPLYSSSVLSCLATFLIQISYKIIYHHSFSANYLVSNCSDTGYPLEPECSITIVVSGTLFFVLDIFYTSLKITKVLLIEAFICKRTILSGSDISLCDLTTDIFIYIYIYALTIFN